MKVIKNIIVKFSFLVVALFIVAISFHRTFAQCDLNFKYKIEHTTNGASNGKIKLKLESGKGPFTIRLFDLDGNNSDFIATKKYTTFSSVGFQVVFDDLKSGNYLVRVENNECRKSLTSIDGLQIK